MNKIYNNAFLRQIKQQISKFESERTQQKETQKNMGSVYTPFQITEFISNNLLKTYLLQILPIQQREVIRNNHVSVRKTLDIILSKFPKTKKNIYQELALLKILDPACGTGRFLFSIAELLSKLLKVLTPEESLYSLKVKILKNNLFGIELDEEAHLISILRMYHWLEESNKSKKIREAKINCGCKSKNKAIFRLINQELEHNIYKKEFLLEFEPNLKFDLIIGNPPYIQNRTITPRSYKNQLYENFVSAYKLFDLSVLFIEKSIKLLRNNSGVLSFILPNKFLSADYGLPIRKLIIKRSEIKEIFHISFLPIFPGTATYPLILTLKKVSDASSNQISVQTFNDLNDFKSNKHQSQFSYAQSKIVNFPNYVIPITGNIKLVSYLYENCTKFSDTYKNLEILYRPYGFLDWSKYFEKLSKKRKSDKDLILLGTGNVGNYHVKFEKSSIIARRAFIPSYYHSNENYKQGTSFLSKEKLFFREVAKKITAVYDPGIFTNITGLYSIRIPSFSTEDYFSLLAVLNSSFINLVFNTLFGTLHMSGGYKRYNGSFIKRLPMPVLIDHGLAKFAKILQFLSQLKYDLRNYPHLFKVIDKNKLISEYFTFFLRVVNILVKVIYCGDLIKNHNNDVDLLYKLLNNQPKNDSFQLKYAVPRFDLLKYTTYTEQELTRHINYVEKIYDKINRNMSLMRAISRVRKWDL